MLLEIIISKYKNDKYNAVITVFIFLSIFNKYKEYKILSHSAFDKLVNYFPWRRFPSYGPLPIEAFNLRKPGASPYLPKPDHHDGNWAYRGA